ncbi:MAG: RNA/single-stranded DNA exonuclease [Ruminococcus sp.]|nr:RNA/single-stranded DNA exonuclease [Ruminococcus sp.]
MKRKFTLGFTIISALLILSSVASALMLREYSNKEFLVAIIPIIIFSAVLITEIILSHKASVRYTAKLNSYINEAENQALYCFENPIVILGQNKEILWCNKEFDAQIIPEEEAVGRDAGKLLNLDIDKLINSGVEKAEINGRIYKINCVSVNSIDNMIYLSFTDISEFAELLGKYKRTRPTVALMVIDNYEDVLQNFKESEKAYVSAAIQTLLEDFMSITTGILRKLDDDKFIAIIENQHLNEIIGSKFNILDNARNISIGGRDNIITFSIGVGRDGETLEENETYARQALDMCLGRGGDQAAIKTENGFRFFGGVAKGVEKKSKAKSRIISNALQEIIASSDSVYVMGHRFADLDAVGSGAGLAYAIRKLGKEAYFVVDFQKNLSQTLIEKIDSKYPDLIISPEEAESTFTSESLLIIVDTHNAELVESKKLFNMANQKVVIDHHRKTVNFINDAVIFHHEPYASSASEMVTEIIQYFKKLNSISQTIAEALLAGIMLDTKNFVMHTGVRTFEAAAYLRKNGADTINVKGFFTSSIDAYKKKSALISSAEIIDNCAVALTEADVPDIRIIAPQAADELLGIQDVKASFVIYKTGNIINISARSLGAMNVQIIMERLGGGGHQTMAAVQLENKSAPQAKQMLIDAINSD